MEGDESRHLFFRDQVVNYLEEHGDELKFFLEDDREWSKYIKDMRESGTYGNHGRISGERKADIWK